jgi:glucokinase
MANTYLGIEIGGTKLQLVTGDAKAIQTRHRFGVDGAKGAEGIRGQIEAALDRILSTSAPMAVAVGFGGPVDYRSGRICRSHQIGGWADFDLHQWLQQLTSKPVMVDNDANMGALGEASRGAGVGFDPVFYITLGSGVGGGLVVGRHIYHGAIPGEAEIGHVRLARDGTTVESRCSGWAVDAKIRQLKASGSKSLLCELVGKTAGGEAKHLAPALAQGDDAAQKILTETANDLAFGLSHVVHLFHPQVIVLGGGLSLVGEPLRAEVARALEGYTMDAFRGGVQARLAALGEDAVPMGCLIAAEELASAAGAKKCPFEPRTGREN